MRRSAGDAGRGPKATVNDSEQAPTVIAIILCPEIRPGMEDDGARFREFAARCGIRVEMLLAPEGTTPRPDPDLRAEWLSIISAPLKRAHEVLDFLWQRRSTEALVVAEACAQKNRATSLVALARFLELGIRGVPAASLIAPSEAVMPSKIQGDARTLPVRLLVEARVNGFPIVIEPARQLALPPMPFPRLADIPALWKSRNSFEAADYDRRAFDSRILPQRIWQRARYRVIMDLFRKYAGDGPTVDIGCGSSVILPSLPRGAIGVDISGPKLRIQRAAGCVTVRADVRHLPFPDNWAMNVVCSEVIEHLRGTSGWLNEIRRVLRPGGLLIIGTPDYGRPLWRITEQIYRVVMPHGYADDHVSRYAAASLDAILREAQFRSLSRRYVFGAELIAAYRSE